jgi:hypothetical protein
MLSSAYVGSCMYMYVCWHAALGWQIDKEYRDKNHTTNESCSMSKISTLKREKEHHARTKKQKTKSNESLARLVEAFNRADNDGEPIAMAHAWKEMKHLGFDPNGELKMRPRLANGCDNLRTHVREMMQLVKILD